MDWQDVGVILTTKSHGEGHALVELFTRAHGRHLGLVRGGLSKTQRPLLQVGNEVEASWRARLENHLGNFTLDVVHSRAGQWMHAPSALHGMALIASYLRLLPERDPHPELYDPLQILLQHLDEGATAQPIMLRFELALLQTLGFGLDLSECASTGAQENLTHISPRSGRAVCAEAAAPYQDKLFRLPAFFLDDAQTITSQDVADGAKLLSYFFDQSIYKPRSLEPPSARALFYRNQQENQQESA